MDQNDVKEMYDNADKFINLANELHKTVSPEKIGLAIRYAAARYTAFVTSLETNNLAEDKEKYLQLFADTFTEMLQNNFDDYIHEQSKIERIREN